MFPETLRDIVSEANRERNHNGEERKAIFSLDDVKEELIAKENPEESAMRNESPRVVNKLLDTLDYREREILKLRYGIGDGYAYTLEEVGRIFKISAERVRQIEERTIKKLRAFYSSLETWGLPRAG